MLATEEYETPRWATLALLVGFLLLAAIGVVTVLIPELEDEPVEPDTQTQAELEPEPRTSE